MAIPVGKTYGGNLHIDADEGWSKHTRSPPGWTRATVEVDHDFSEKVPQMRDLETSPKN